ncbi:MAG: gephyrin-like molybdotransferase Glp [Dehalococcoidia bacterium]
MITIKEALHRILAYVSQLPAEQKHPMEALGQVLADDIHAGFDIPPLDNTAMDGYAVIASDTSGAAEGSPVELRVIGEVAAGYVYEGAVSSGTAVRIMTGAPLPAGADSVVPFEETDEPFDQAPSQTGQLAARVRVFKEARPGANIRKAAEDIHAGEVVVRKGTVLRPQEIGVIASVGLDRVSVIRRPVVAILSTGDELLEPGQPRSGARIYDANTYSVGSLARRFGAEPRLMGIARDTVEALTEKIQEARSADMIVTSAGVSRGDYDVVKDVLAREGEIDFWTVAMKPGKPLAFGAFKQNGRTVPHIGLPGNPVSSMVAFELFGRPAIFRMMGKADFRRPVVTAIAEDRITNRDDPRLFLARCIVSERGGRYYARLTGEQGSGILTSMMRANALTLIPPEVDVIEPGEEISVMMLDWGRGEAEGSFLSDETPVW